MLKKVIPVFLLFSFVFGQEKLPDISLKLLSGRTTNLYELLNDGPVIIDFWATWCSPCKKLMKHLDKFHKHFNEYGLNVLAVSTDTPRSMGKVKSFIRSNKYDFLVGLDPNQQVMKKCKAEIMPTTIILNQDGDVIYRHQGYYPGDEDKILKVLHDYYDKQKLHYVLDTYHRECLHIPMSKICKNDDLIIISDLDEIPKDEILKNIGNFKKPLVCRQNEFKYYLNLYSNNKWNGSIIDRYSVIKNKSLNILRKESNKFNILYPGGYHFTSIGKENEIINKIENWGHQEYNRKFIKNNVHKNIIKGRDIFYRIGEKKNIVIDLENSKIFDQNMARIIKNKNLILVSRKKESIFEKFEYRITQIIFYLIRAQEEPLQFIKKILLKLKILK